MQEPWTKEEFNLTLKDSPPEEKRSDVYFPPIKTINPMMKPEITIVCMKCEEEIKVLS